MILSTSYVYSVYVRIKHVQNERNNPKIQAEVCVKIYINSFVDIVRWVNVYQAMQPRHQALSPFQMKRKGPEDEVEANGHMFSDAIHTLKITNDFVSKMGNVYRTKRPF